MWPPFALTSACSCCLIALSLAFSCLAWSAVILPLFSSLLMRARWFLTRPLTSLRRGCFLANLPPVGLPPANAADDSIRARAAIRILVIGIPLNRFGPRRGLKNITAVGLGSSLVRGGPGGD